MDGMAEETRLPADIDAQSVVQAAAALHPVLRKYHDEIEREIFDKELGAVAEALLVEGVQQRVPGAVGSGTGAFRQPLAPLHGVAAE